MIESITNRNTLTKSAFAVISVGLATIALSGCDPDKKISEVRDSATVAERYGFDYVGSEVEGYSRVNKGKEDLSCLDETPYSIGRVVIAKEGDDGVIVTPGSNKFKPLHFSGLHDTTEPLQPVDTYTKNVLENYGCQTGHDGSVVSWG